MVGSDADELNDVHCELLVDVGHVVTINDVELDVIEQVVVKVNHDDVWNLNVVNLLEDGHGIVDAASLRCVDKSAVNVELSKEDVHLNGGEVVVKVEIAEDAVIHVNVVVSQDVDVRVDADLTRIVTASSKVVVVLDVGRKADEVMILIMLSKPK